MPLIADDHVEILVEQRNAAREIVDHSLQQPDPLARMLDQLAHPPDRFGQARQADP
ncbi:hypothetical protein [Mesorhizobium sp. LjNodule214]|uniref:hypothetical protein n=1 Tax=Mesorhizobium sp. LjNodule214 TaxID=3342252 RepID=UPI003ECE0E9E